MKIGWLVYSSYYDDDGVKHFMGIEFYEEKPDYYSGKLVQIVYTEVIPHAN